MSVPCKETCHFGFFFYMLKFSTTFFFVGTLFSYLLSLMAYYKNDGLDPVGAPHAYEKQEVGKPSRNAAQPCAVYDDPYRGDELRDGWAFRVGTWNVDSLTGRLGDLVEALAERRMDVLCVQETRWRSDCRLFGAIGKRYKLFFDGK